MTKIDDIERSINNDDPFKYQIKPDGEVVERHRLENGICWQCRAVNTGATYCPVCYPETVPLPVVKAPRPDPGWHRARLKSLPNSDEEWVLVKEPRFQMPPRVLRAGHSTTYYSPEFDWPDLAKS